MVYVINRWVLYEKVRGKYTIKKYISYKKKYINYILVGQRLAIYAKSTYYQECFSLNLIIK